MFFVFLFKGYGARLELHVRTHSVPTRSSADRPPRNALGRAAWLWPVPSALAALGRRLRNSLGRPAIGGLILTAPCRAQAITQPLRHALGLVAQGAHCLRDPGADVAQLLGQLAPLLIACPHGRSEEHTSELQSLMRISYAVFCLNKKKHTSLRTHT